MVGGIWFYKEIGDVLLHKIEHKNRSYTHPQTHTHPPQNPGTLTTSQTDSQIPTHINHIFTFYYLHVSSFIGATIMWNGKNWIRMSFLNSMSYLVLIRSSFFPKASISLPSCKMNLVFHFPVKVPPAAAARVWRYYDSHWKSLEKTTGHFCLLYQNLIVFLL